MALTVRKGKYSEFDIRKLLPGEIAVVTEGDPKGLNGRGVYVAVAAGDVRRMVSEAEVQQMIANALANLKGA